MKTLIIILIIASFLQATIIPINLVLIVLICRAYVRPDKTNLLLAFSFGLLTSHLNLNPFGLESMIFLVIVQISGALSKSPLATNYLTIMPISFGLLSLNLTISSLLTNQAIHLMPQILLESLLSLPIFYLVRFWEERFVIRKEIKLRI